MCTGAIDGTHIPILAPEENHLVYVNWKGYHSIIMRVVVDSGYTVEAVYYGHPRDFRNWPLNAGGRLIQDH